MSFSTKQATYPVIVFSHGLSSARWLHNATCASMAKQGYIVLVVEHSLVLCIVLHHRQGPVDLLDLPYATIA